MPRPASFSALVERAPFTASGQTFIPDPTLPGFRVVIGKRTKTYTISIDVQTIAGRKTHKEAIARVGEVDYRTARNAAMEKMALLRSGRRAPGVVDRGPTLREAWDRYRVGHLERKGRAQGTIDQYRDCIERTLASWLDTPLGELAENPAAVARRHDEITRENGPYQANHAMRSLRAIYRHARKAHKSLPVEHPCTGVDYNAEHKRESGLDAAELRRWWATWATIQNPIRRELHLLTLLSASRRTALCEARWEHVRPFARVLHQPRPKGGAKKAFDIPLSRAMVASLRRLRAACRVAYDGTPWLFPSDTSESGHATEVKETHIEGFATGHALRHTWITQSKAVVNPPLPRFLCKLISNHGKIDGDDVHDGYTSVPALRRELRAVQERVSQHLLGLATPEARELLSRRGG